MNLANEFEKRGPWITGFEIGGEWYGGDYRPATDWRLAKFREAFPNARKSILELGPLEGGFTVELARQSLFVRAIEGRAANIARMRWILEITGVNNVEILEEDIDTTGWDDGQYPPARLPPYTVCFNVGVLYHLQRPWDLLARLKGNSNAMFLWTHIATEETANWGGYAGIIHPEGQPDNPLSGLGIGSFWPTFPELLRMLADTGWASVEVIDKKEHPADSEEFSECLLICR